jgi:hypothetical protein
MNFRRSISISILVLLGCGLIVRLLLAYVILPDSYGSRDIFSYAYWAHAIANVGIGNLYASVQGVDYPPGYLYVLWLIGEVGRTIAAAANMDALRVTASLIRIPTILFDLCAGFLLYLIARMWATNSANAERIALMAAAIYLFNPVALYDSAIWGQTDAIGACFALLAVIALTKWPSEVAAAVAVLAALTKLQFGVIIVPLIGIVLLRRHLFSGNAFPAGASLKPAYWPRHDGPIRLLTSALVAIIIFYVLITPFNLDAHSFLQRMAKTADYYHYLSVNAFNPWALVGSGGATPIAFASPEVFGSPSTWSDDRIPLLGPLTGTTIGTCLLVLGFLLGGARLFWRTDRWSVVLVGAFLSMCFFMLPTRVHERYIFAAFAFVSLLAAFDRKWLWAMVALSVASFMNLHGIFTMVIDNTEESVRLPLSEFFRTPTGVTLSVALHSAVFIFAIWRLRPKAVQSEMRWSDAVRGASTAGTAVHGSPEG